MHWSWRAAFGVFLLASLLSGWQWTTSTVHTLDSAALHESRIYRVFNPHSNAQIVYSLDGDTLRNSLAPAVVFSVGAILSGQEPPKIVAIYSNANRDRDFRPATSAPTYWRHQIVGRSIEFDRFLLGELLPAVEGRQHNDTRRYIMGHSLSGLYALDLATRVPGRFNGVFAYAPTFSHDMTISDRLPIACNNNTILYANWGLESARDTEVFATVAARWKADRRCYQRPPIAARHYGSLHQIIMLTGHMHAAFWLFT